MLLPPQVNTVLTLLNEAGFEAYLVGGAVRDYVRAKAPAKDWDVATNALPGQICSVFSQYRLIETGVKHGTVTVLSDGLPIEITTYRVDGDYSDHRHPDSVRFTAALREDLERRDLTMNALAYHPKTGVVDLVGGRADLAAGLIRCVGDPDRRFREDALRILRALRFASTFDMRIEPATAHAVRKNRHLLSGIAPERICSELTALLCGPGAEGILTEFADVLSVPLPELAPMFGFEQHNPHHDRDVWLHTAAAVAAIPPDPVLRWAALLHDVGKPHCFTSGEDGVGHFYGHAERSTELAGQILSRLCFDNDRRDRILRLVRYHDLPLAPEKKFLRRLLNKHGPDAVRRLIELHRADTLGQSPLCRYRLPLYEQVGSLVEELLAEQACFSLRDLAVNGHDLLALGLSGPELGAALQHCLDAVMDERIANDRDSLLQLCRRLQHEQKAL